MAEHEPLHEACPSEPNGRIVGKANGHAVANGKPTVKANGAGGGADGEAAAQQPHIEAPCCRDIHGKEPPDGGAQAWLVMVSAFICNGVIFGFINTYGVLHKLLVQRLTEQGDADASSKAGKSHIKRESATFRIPFKSSDPRQIDS